MNDLIVIGSSAIGGAPVPTVNARELHQFLESNQQFANWIRNRIEQYGFLEGHDFTVNKFINGKTTQIDYHLTFDMAKELAMVERNYRGKQARLYFIECERKAKAIAVEPKPLALDDPHQLRQALLSYSEKVIVLEAQVQEQAPKVEALDRIAESDGSLTVRAAAKVAQMQEKDFKQMLFDIGWVYLQGKKLHGYSPILAKGFIVHKLYEYRPNKTDHQVRMTPKGMAELAAKFIPDFIASLP